MMTSAASPETRALLCLRWFADPENRDGSSILRGNLTLAKEAPQEGPPDRQQADLSARGGVAPTLDLKSTNGHALGLSAYLCGAHKVSYETPSGGKGELTESAGPDASLPGAERWFLAQVFAAMSEKQQALSDSPEGYWEHQAGLQMELIPSAWAAAPTKGKR